MDPQQLDNIFKVLPLDIVRHEILPRLEPEDIIRFFLASREHLSWIPYLGFDFLVNILTTHPGGGNTIYGFDDDSAYGTKWRSTDFPMKRVPILLDDTQCKNLVRFWDDVEEHEGDYDSQDPEKRRRQRERKERSYCTPPCPRRYPMDDFDIRARRVGDYLYYETDAYIVPYPFIKNPETRAPIEFKFYDYHAFDWAHAVGFPQYFTFIYWTYYAYAAYLWSCAEATWFYAYGERLKDYMTDSVPHLLNTAVATGVFGVENITTGDRIFLKFRAPRELARRKINDKGHYDAVAEMHMDLEFASRIKPRPFDVHVKLPEVFSYGTAIAAFNRHCKTMHYCPQETAHLQYDMALHDTSHMAEVDNSI